MQGLPDMGRALGLRVEILLSERGQFHDADNCMYELTPGGSDRLGISRLQFAALALRLQGRGKHGEDNAQPTSCTVFNTSGTEDPSLNKPEQLVR